jgi:hypothetical protein
MLSVVLAKNDEKKIFRESTLAIGTQKVMASTVVFVRVIFDLEHSISSDEIT